MKPKNTKTHIASTAVLTALVVGIINTFSALVAYSYLVPKKPELSNEPLISESPSKEKETAAVTTPTDTGYSNFGTTSSRPNAASVLRSSESPIVVGQTAQPANIITESNGQVRYQWCSGVNPNLEDAVCEAIISIASNPTASNPHLGEKAVQSLSLLPRNISLTMHEKTWTSDVSHYGTMIITAHTTTYGDVDIKLAMEKVNGVWIIQDGYLA